MILPALKKTYQGQLVLDIPSIEIADGSIVAICGQNGSGKSTLAKILAGIEKPDTGSIMDESARSAGYVFNTKHCTVGYLPQQSYAFHMSVRSNVLLNKDPKKTKSGNFVQAETLLQKIGLTGFSKKNAKKLSGGETQKMALVRLLMKPYDLLILDEPTASMDTASLPAAEDIIRDYQRRTGCTILIITHSPEQAARLADQIIRLDDGIIQA